MADGIAIARVEVFPGRLRAFVRLAEDASRYVDESMYAGACGAYPTLPLHSCINSKGPTFGDVAVGTSVPHLLEHLVIAEQVRLAGEGRDGLPPAQATFVGTTAWTEGGAALGEAVVEVSFVDDLAAIEALSRSLMLANDLLSFSKE